jgi:hypothetical protein
MPAPTDEWNEWFAIYWPCAAEHLQRLHARLAMGMRERYGRAPSQEEAAWLDRVITPGAVPSAEVVHRLQQATVDDIAWLRGALKDEQKKWFVADVARAAASIPVDLFLPLMDAGINHPDPSFNARFIQPCVRVFGQRPVHDYLASVIEHSDTRGQCGAVRALYWGGLWPLLKSPPPPECAPELHVAAEQLQDVLERLMRALLVAFVGTCSLPLRQQVRYHLPRDPDARPDPRKPLALRAREIDLELEQRGEYDEAAR